jgi:hypothetical protein
MGIAVGATLAGSHARATIERQSDAEKSVLARLTVA